MKIETVYAIAVIDYSVQQDDFMNGRYCEIRQNDPTPLC